jgi:hypothetical protein
MKPRRMRWAENVKRMGRSGMLMAFWWEGQKEIYKQEVLDVGRRIML